MRMLGKILFFGGVVGTLARILMKNRSGFRAKRMMRSGRIVVSQLMSIFRNMMMIVKMR